MSKNSTLKLWNHLLKDEYTLFERSAYETSSEIKEEPKRETINTILSYASSVKAIKLELEDKILISLN
jgi:hypothetical protein